MLRVDVQHDPERGLEGRLVETGEREPRPVGLELRKGVHLTRLLYPIEALELAVESATVDQAQSDGLRRQHAPQVETNQTALPHLDVADLESLPVRQQHLGFAHVETLPVQPDALHLGQDPDLDAGLTGELRLARQYGQVELVPPGLDLGR